MHGVADLPALLQAARALGADAVVDPDLDVGDPRVQLQAAALVYGAAEAGVINAVMESARLGVDNPIDQINTVVAEAAGLGDLDTAVAWMTWNANRVAELAAQHVDEHPSPELAAATALATASQRCISTKADLLSCDHDADEAARPGCVRRNPDSLRAVAWRSDVVGTPSDTLLGTALAGRLPAEAARRLGLRHIALEADHGRKSQVRAVSEG